MYLGFFPAHILKDEDFFFNLGYVFNTLDA